ncbi:2-iminobutanoate/2-iminopropanoate deaminase [Clostridium amylolyticum]|uniref:2-iminobutanoate/2-iminopropanoate deaminase n=1 Tax=Clostridium amylolyticum TaxID=1121298 RepID=A0A1M6AZ38_9CLOT|nr:RidA family protein [Clostridium amylolyticum]SHI41745.1 2-iminobutanoate/2-iminopropanoate deaminase [Clostridium amylolyticum]
MKKQIISTELAPKAIGPYSQGIKIGNMVYTSGQLPIDAATGIMETEIGKATAKCIENVKAILEEAGSSLDSVIKTLVFLENMDDFAAMNEVYGKYFNENPPARSCVQVAKLPKGAVVEIEVIALCD